MSNSSNKNRYESLSSNLGNIFSDKTAERPFQGSPNGINHHYNPKMSSSFAFGKTNSSKNWIKNMHLAP